MSQAFPSRATLVAAMALALLAGCAGPSGGAAAPAPQPMAQIDQLLNRAAPDSAALLTITPPVARVGETIALQVSAPRAGYVYLFQVGTNGKELSMGFPNAMDGANHLAAGATLALPRANWRLSARGPAGTGYLLAVVADRPQDLLRLGAEVAQGRIGIDGPYAAAMATLREVAP